MKITVLMTLLALIGSQNLCPQAWGQELVGIGELPDTTAQQIQAGFEEFKSHVTVLSQDDPRAFAPEVASLAQRTGILGMIKNLPGDVRAVIVAPLHWNQDAWLKVVYVTSLTTSAFFADDEVKSFALDHQSSRGDQFAKTVRQAGEIQWIFPAVFASYGLGKLTDNEKIQEASLRAVEDMAVTDLFNSLVKLTFHRTRPNSTDEVMDFHGPGLSTASANVSFSSGHTSTAFALATAFAEVYGDYRAVPILAYTAAGLVGASRIYNNMHWLSDTIFGASIGIFSSKLVGCRRDANAGKPCAKLKKVKPIFDQDPFGQKQIGVSLPLSR